MAPPGQRIPAPLALTMGDPAGIGPEITLKAYQRLKAREDLLFFVIADPRALAVHGRSVEDAPRVVEIASPRDAAAAWRRGLPVLPLALPGEPQPGKSNKAHAPAVVSAIDMAVRLTMTSEASAVVTNPIHKRALYDVGFSHPGHTDYLAALTRASRAPVMMLSVPELRVVPVTVHIPIKDVPKALNVEKIVHAARVTAEALTRDFGIAKPRLAVTGLNPHAGEEGTMGLEEAKIIGPAVAALRALGHIITGPKPADTMFHPQARAQYDAALCMYHDQALIPLKTIDFVHGVNVTLGLPIVRTSPDHGTAFDIAGQGVADPESLIAAIEMAASVAARRQAAR